MRRPGVRPIVAASLCLLCSPSIAVADTRAGAARAVGEDVAIPLPAAEIGKAQAASGDVPRVPVAPLGVLPGEFETQRAIVIGCAKMTDEMPDLLAQIALHTRGRLNVIALVHGDVSREKAIQVLTDHHVTAPHVRYVNVPHDSMWVRDFGPLTVRQFDGRPAMVDPWYTSAERPEDDAVPVRLAEAMETTMVPASLFLDGGNLLSNGRGLLVATYQLVEKNLGPACGPPEIRLNLGQLFGARQVVFLEPLIGEPTGHVDMFTTFVSPDTVVLASLDPTVDKENARILDQNAARLASVRVGRGRLRVVRMPMPSHDDTIWRSYTNVMYANGLLLVPIYPEKDLEGSNAALAIYRRLLPDWQVEPIDAEALAGLGGALHCVTMNMTLVERLPAWVEAETPQRAFAQWTKERRTNFDRRVFGVENGLEMRLLNGAGQ